MQNAKPKKKKLWILLFVLLIVGIFLDSHFRLVKTEYELSYDNLPESFDGYRIVQLSDLHLAQFGENNQRLLEAVKSENPDIIVLTGDFIEKRSPRKQGTQTQRLRPFLTELSKVAPCYFISGNHEWASGEIQELSTLLTELKIKYLHNEYVLLERNGQQIVLAGVEDKNGLADQISPSQLVDIIKSNQADKFIVFLGHRNDWLEKYPDLSVDIILCGHAHGGVLRLPFVGGVFSTDVTLFPKYDAGVYNEGSFDMVLSRGLGGSIPLPRFLNNPELVTVVLKRR